jgi:hypothetical protein
MLSLMDVRGLYADTTPDAFVARLHESLGIRWVEAECAPEPSGFRRVGAPQFAHDEITRLGSGAFMAKAIFGSGWQESLAPVMAGGPRGMSRLMEGTGPGLHPSQFTVSLSAWNRAVGGVISARILESYQEVENETNQLIRTEHSDVTSEKRGGIGGWGDQALERKPSMPHADAGLKDHYVETDVTKEHALKVQVLKEAGFFDPTGEIMRRAAQVGNAVALRKRKRVLDLVLGLTGGYNYNGTTYGTFLTTGIYVNDHSNPLVDWVSADTSLQLFAGLTDPLTGEPIEVTPTVVLVMPGRGMTADHLFNADEIEARTPTTQAVVTRFRNRLAGKFQVIVSVYAYARLTAPVVDGGGGLSAAAAKEYWFAGNPQRAFVYLENWPLTVSQASATDFDMLDRGVIAAYFANERGAPSVEDPRWWQRNKN